MSNKGTNPPRRYRPRFRYRMSTKDLIAKLNEKLAVYEEEGTTVRLNEDPFVVVIVTPFMKRAHNLKSSSEVVLVDSTSANDSDDYCATFLFCPCVAGVAPLAAIVMKEETDDSYVIGFKLLNDALESPFYGKGSPSVFLTDNSEAQKKALSLVWPESEAYLCSFRVMQEVWRHVWDSKHNHVPREHRTSLVSSFQDVLYAQSPAEAEGAYGNAFNLASRDLPRYKKWLEYLQDLWSKKELWCLAFRSETVRRHNSNEFLEVSIKVFKDLVFSPLKACYVSIWIDYLSRLLEKLYRLRLTDFADTACPRLFLLSLKSRVLSLIPKEAVEEIDENSYLVNVKRDSFFVYSRSSCCSCRIRLKGRYCEHQYSVLEHFPIVSRNFPPLRPEDKDEVLALACPPEPEPEYVPEPEAISLSSETSSTSEQLDIKLEPHTSYFTQASNVVTPSTSNLQAQIPIQTKSPVSDIRITSTSTISKKFHDNLQSLTPTQASNVVIASQHQNAPYLVQGSLPFLPSSQTGQVVSLPPQAGKVFAYCVLPVSSSATSTVAPPDEEMEKKKLLKEIHKKITQNYRKYMSSLSGLKSVLARLNAVNSSDSWEAFLNGAGQSTCPPVHPNITRTLVQLPPGSHLKHDLPSEASLIQKKLRLN